MIYTISHLVTGSLFGAPVQENAPFGLPSIYVQPSRAGTEVFLGDFLQRLSEEMVEVWGKKKKKKTPGGQREDTSTRRPPSKQTSKNAAMKWWNALNLCLQWVSTSLWTWLCPEARSGNLLLWISSHPTKMPGRLFGCARWNAQFKPRLWVILQG